MMDTVTLTIIILMSVVFGLIIIFAFIEGRRIIKGRKTFVKTPKVRGRAILWDEEKFGSARVTGYQMADGMKAAYIFLRSRDDVDFKQFYHKDELVPDNAVLAMAGMEPALWRVKTSVYSDGRNADSERIKLEKQHIEMLEKTKAQKVETAIKVNQAAALPDVMEDLIKEMNRPKQQEIKVSR